VSRSVGQVVVSQLAAQLHDSSDASGEVGEVDVFGERLAQRGVVSHGPECLQDRA
jgi:hypothetical protein